MQCEPFAKTMDWRAQLRRNQIRTYWVIVLFITFYLLLGLLIDTFIACVHYPHIEISTLFLALISFHLMPLATLATSAIAIISLLVTYNFYDKIMLLGTNYREISPETVQTAQEKQLLNSVEELAIAAGLRYMPRIYIIATDSMNAFASGYNEQTAMIAITRGLLAKLDRNEIQAVIAHELSHIRHGDIKLTLMASVLTNIMLIAVDILVHQGIFNYSRPRKGGGRLMLIIIVLRYLLPMVTFLLSLYLSRTREYMADAGCVELMRDNKALASALIKIDEDYQFNADTYNQEYGRTAHENVRRAAYLFDPSQCGVHGLQSLATVFSTHPNIKARLTALGIKTGYL